MDNVLYEISNENHPPSTKWQYHMIRFIKEYEKSKPLRGGGTARLAPPVRSKHAVVYLKRVP